MKKRPYKGTGIVFSKTFQTLKLGSNANVLTAPAE